jgi:hypothetical protein
MGGGLLQLVAYGDEDVLITGNPQITFFNMVYRKHTPFAKITTEQTLNGIVKPDTKISFNISRDGDLLSNVILKTIGATNDSFKCIDYIEIEIGSQIIDTHYNLWLNLWTDLTNNIDKTKVLNTLRKGFNESIKDITIDKNQPSPPEVNSLEINQIINYPGVKNLGPHDIIKNDIGLVYFTKKISHPRRLSVINLDGSVNHSFSQDVGFNAETISIQNNSIFVIQDNESFISRINLNNEGLYQSQINKYIMPGGANADIAEYKIPEIINGKDNVGYFAGKFTSISSNENLLLISSDSEKKIFSIHDNSDHHYERITFPTTQSPIFSTIIDNEAGLLDGEGSIAKLSHGDKILSVNYDNSFLIIGEKNKGIIRKVDLLSDNQNVTTIVGNTLDGDVDQRGNINGSVGISKIGTIGSISFFPDNKQILITDLDNGIKLLDIETTIITLINNEYKPDYIAIHPIDNYALGVKTIGNHTQIHKFMLDNPSEVTLWWEDDPTATPPSKIGIGKVNGIFISKQANYLILQSDGIGQSQNTGLFRYFDLEKDPYENDGILRGFKKNHHYARTIALDSESHLLYFIETPPDNSNISQIKRTDITSQDADLGDAIIKNLSISYPQLTTGNTNLTVSPDGKIMFYSESNSKIKKILLKPKKITFPNYYFKQYTSILKDVNNESKIVNVFKIDSNNNIYLCFKFCPGLYKISSNHDKENTQVTLIDNSETLIKQGNGILLHSDNSIYISCIETHRIIRYHNNMFTIIAGDGTSGTINSLNCLNARFSTIKGICITNFNDILICDSKPTFITNHGSLRIIGGYKPFNTRTKVVESDDAYVPLQFWFCRNPGLAIPLIALQYNDVKINIKLAKSLDGITKLELLADYILLDNEEKRRFSQNSHEYLIEQVQYSNKINLGSHTITNSSSKEIINITELLFNHPVKELIWTINQSNLGPNGITQACSLENNGGNQNIQSDKVLLQFNGEDRFTKRDGKFFTKIQRYAHHSGAGINLTRIGVGSSDVSSDLVTSKWYPLVCNTHIYSFSLNPEEHQPSGTCNFSRLDKPMIHNTFSTPPINGTYNYNINIFATNYNMLKIADGMAGLAYSE